MNCLSCGSDETIKKGIRNNKQRYLCHSCGCWFVADIEDESVPQENNSVNIGVIDIETLPMISYTWGMYDQNISTEQVIENICMLSWAGKILNASEMFYDVLTPKEAKERNAERITKSIWNFMSKCQIIIGHNFRNFDSKLINTAFLMYGLKPLKYQIIDTLEAARSNFRFSSNKLIFINKYLGIRNKIDNDGFPLWKRASNGDKDALNIMLEYNLGDIYATEELYYRLRSYIPNHPNLAKYNNIEDEQCPVCLSKNIVVEGIYSTKQYESVRCQDCNSLSRRKANLFSKEKRKNLLIKL